MWRETLTSLAAQQAVKIILLSAVTIGLIIGNVYLARLHQCLVEFLHMREPLRSPPPGPVGLPPWPERQLADERRSKIAMPPWAYEETAAITWPSPALRGKPMVPTIWRPDPPPPVEWNLTVE